MYRCFLKNHETLIAPEGPLAAFREQQTRVLFRPSRIYSYLLNKTINPQYLRSGLDRGIEFEVLRGKLDHPQEGKILTSEQRALQRMDIPYFTSRVDGQEIRLADGQVLQDYFSPSVWERVTKRAQQLNELDLKHQLKLIKQSIAPGPPPVSSSQPV